MRIGPQTRWKAALQALLSTPVIGAAILIWFVVLTHQRNELWRSPLRLWLDAAEKSPRKIRPLVNAGMYLKEAGRRDEAKTYFTRALASGGNTPVDDQLRGIAKTNLAYLAIESGDYPAAARLIGEVLAVAPNLDAINAYALLLLISGDPESAVTVTGDILAQDAAWRLRPSLWATRGQAFQLLGRCDEAQAAYVTIKFLMPEFRIPSCP